MRSATPQAPAPSNRTARVGEPVAGNSRRSARGEATRSTIIDTALRLFRDQGYEGTTMRAIAAEAGVSLGNAYYYFTSKEHLILGFYDRAGAEHRAQATKVLAREASLEGRLIGVIDEWIAAMRPYKEFAAAFFRTAADPASPLSPFSDASRPAREATISLYREVLAGSDVVVPAALEDTLPELLWLYFMGVVLFWVHDSSRASQKTRLLHRRITPILVQAIRLSAIPMLEPTVVQLSALVRELRTN